jgi:hypothetical protein
MFRQVLAYWLMVVLEVGGGDGFVVSGSARCEMMQAVSSVGRLFNDMSGLASTSRT